MRAADDLRAALPAALPVMLGYVAIGIPCGVLSAPWAFLISATYYSGAGQFMMASLALSGTPLAAMVASVALVGTRQLLYSAALAPYLERAPRPLAALFAATVTDESFGVNLERLVSDRTWTPERATVVNLACMLSWAVANALGAAVGPALALPTAVMSFAMTSIFICLLATQRWSVRTAVAALVAAGAAVALKLAGAGSLAVLLGALAGVAGGMALPLGRGGGAQ